MISLIHGDCLELLKDIPDKSVDMILCDPPYGKTQCKWDSVIPIEPMWEQLNRVIKDHGVICLFSKQPFSSHLVTTNERMFRYEIIWEKSNASGFLNANRMPLTAHENLLIFYKKIPCYHPPTLETGQPYFRCRSDKGEPAYRPLVPTTSQSDGPRKPRSVVRFSNTKDPERGLHPTQKPVALCEWLISTYTEPGETVLDFCMGSGTTGVACVKTGRNFIGMDLDEEYCKTAEERIEKWNTRTQITQLNGITTPRAEG